MQQGTDEWLTARNGKVTASHFGCLLTEGRGGPFGEEAVSYLYTLLSQRILGFEQNPYTNPAMEWGRVQEADARAAYQWFNPINVAEVGFVNHPTIPNVGSSPDGVIREKLGIIEIKCPYTTKEHLRNLDTKRVPKQYVAQVQGNLWVTGYEWCDFISFDARVPEEMQLSVVRVERDERYIEKLAARVAEFAALVDLKESEMRRGKAA